MITTSLIPIDEVVYFDVCTHAPSTGAVSDADSTPTFDVFEEATDTAILSAQNFTKRTSLTGDYRGTFTASAANGFEAGKWYSVIASATVGGVAAKKNCGSFRCAPAENAAGAPIVDARTYAVASVTGNVGGNVVGSVGSVVGAVGSVTGAVGSVTGNVGGNVTGSVGSVATGGITAASIAADAIGASELAADAVAEIADAVWDEVLSGHLTSGTTGAGLNAAGSAGDPWATSVPGAYGAGTAGKILGDNLNATVSSRLASASYTAPLDASGTATATQTGLTAQGYTTTRAGYLDTLNGLVSAIWSAVTRTLTAGTNIVLAKGTGVTGFTDLDAAGVRTAVGLASANLDTQLDALPTNAELATALGTADDAVLAAIAALNNLSSAGAQAAASAALTAYGAALQSTSTAIKAKTDNLTFTSGTDLDVNVQKVNDVALTGVGTSGDPWGPV